MLALKIVCWLVILGSVLGGDWKPENYFSNTLIFIVCILVLTAMYVTELVAK
ncbi:hypothetical protein MEZE111188_00325 [Mesobacillus zeae]